MRDEKGYDTVEIQRTLENECFIEVFDNLISIANNLTNGDFKTNVAKLYNINQEIDFLEFGDAYALGKQMKIINFITKNLP